LLRIGQLVISLPLVILSSVPSVGSDSSAIAVLKKKGHTRSGPLFVIEAEPSALEKWKATRTVLADDTATAERRNEAVRVAREFAELEQHRAELQEKLTELNQHINEQGFRRLTTVRAASAGGPTSRS
jgi:hypothetical protein